MRIISRRFGKLRHAEENERPYGFDFTFDMPADAKVQSASVKRWELSIWYMTKGVLPKTVERRFVIIYSGRRFDIGNDLRLINLVTDDGWCFHVYEVLDKNKC